MKLRILHTNMHRGGWGGQPNRILLLCKGLKDKGHHVIIAAPKGATLIKRAKEEGIPTYDDLEFPKKFKPHVVISEIIKLKRLIEKEKIDIVHTHGSQDTWAATIAAKLVRNKPIIIRTRHNTFPVANHPGNRILHRVWIDHIIVVSQGIIDTYKSTKVLGDRINFITTIYSVIEPQRFKQAHLEASKIKDEFGLSPHKIVFTKVGRLAREKGHIYFLKIAKNISSKINSLFFALGEGPLRNELEKIKDKWNLKDVIFTGIRQDVPGFLKLTDVFIFTPISGESLGTSILESLYSKVPVVSFKIEGINASIEHGKNGFLVKPKDSTTSSTICLKLATNIKKRKKLGINGHKKITSQFIVNNLIDSTEKLYLEKLKGRRNSTPPL